MTIFISKKQRGAIKERRRKKILAEKGLLPPSHGALEHNDTNGSPKKRPRNDDTDGDEEGIDPRMTTISQRQEKSPSGSSKPLVLKLPSGLTSRDAKKMRKDMRRKARGEGNESVVFVDANQDADANVVVEPAKKHKRVYPNINELVKQERLSTRETEKQKAQDELSDEYKARYVALDCEMVGIGTEGRQSALARVSIVNWNGETLLDTFVQVPTKVTDFRTFVSGVKAKHIQSSKAMSEKTCRETVAEIIRGKIVVGHALKNDWQALMLQHAIANCRDTATYRPFQRLAQNKKWRPRKLRDLVLEHCGVTIQATGQSHDSVDDAKATMQLFQTVHVAWEKELELKAKKKTLSASR